MARIPIYTASPSLQAGPVSPEASPLAFNPTAGLGAVAHGVDSVGEVAAAYSAKKEKDIATTWTNSKLNEFEDKANKFLTDEAQKDNVNVANDLKTWADGELKRMGKEAPNKTAAKLFSIHSGNSLSTKYASALGQGARAMVSVADTASKETVAAIVSNYRTGFTRDPVEASISLEAAYKKQIDWIDSTRGEVAPSLAARMRADSTENIALGVMDNNPKFAQEIITKSKDIEESRKQIILNKIDAASHRSDLMGQLSLTSFMERRLQIAGDTLEPERMPDKKEFAVFGERADVKLAEYAIKYKAVNDAAKAYPEMADKRADYQLKKLTQLNTDPNSLTGGETAKILAHRVSLAAKQQREDLGGWLAANNPEVRAYVELSESAPSEQEQSLYRDMAMDAMLAYQQSPPANASEAEAAKYFDIPNADRLVLTDSQAASLAERFNAAPPQEQAQLLDSFNETYGRHADYAWRNLERVPKEGKEISMELQVARLIESKTIRANVLGAMKNKEVIKALSEERRSKFVAASFSDNELKAFTQAKLGDNFQGTPEAAAIQNMVITYAQSMAMESKLSDKDAVTQAVRRIIGNNVHVRSVNGQAMMIPAETRTSEEATVVADALSRRIANFPVSTVDWRKVGLSETGLKDQDKVNLISSQGFFRTEPDGESVTLYLGNRAGPPVQLTDKSNQPFTFRFSDMKAPVYGTEKSWIELYGP